MEANPFLSVKSVPSVVNLFADLFRNSVVNMKRLLIIALLAASLVAAARLVGAHGIGTPHLLNEPAGPYLLSIWTDPDPLRADETHVVVAVTDPATREPIVAGVEVTVTLTSLAAPALAHTAVAGPDSVNRLLFAAEFNDRLTPGNWRVTVVVTGARGDTSEVTFEVAVAAARGFNWLWIGVGGLAGILLVWVVVSARPARSRSRPETRQ